VKHRSLWITGVDNFSAAVESRTSNEHDPLSVRPPGRKTEPIAMPIGPLNLDPGVSREAPPRSSGRTLAHSSSSRRRSAGSLGVRPRGTRPRGARPRGTWPRDGRPATHQQETTNHGGPSPRSPARAGRGANARSWRSFHVKRRSEGRASCRRAVLPGFRAAVRASGRPGVRAGTRWGAATPRGPKHGPGDAGRANELPRPGASATHGVPIAWVRSRLTRSFT
jgi:hypothetical protein